jgi:metal-responsive CopG/Arc/MetJ family transcriptional regulator
MARIIISLPDELLQELDTYAEDRMYNRSECIRHAIRLIVQKEEKYVVRETTTEEDTND